MSVVDKIKELVASYKDEMLDFYEDLVNIDSAFADKAEVDRAQRLYGSRLEELGASVKYVPMKKAGDVLVADWNKEAGGQPIIFLGHMDTVFEPGEGWGFSLDLEEDRVYGPGVYDMKGGLVIALYTLKALKALGYDRYYIKFVIVGDEEPLHMDSNAKEVMQEEMKDAQIVINFESGNPDGGIIIGQKGAAIAKFDVQGIPAHSGDGVLVGRSAILEAAHKILALQEIQDIDAGKYLNVGRIEGGAAVNIIPGDVTVNFGFRFQTNELAKEMLQEVDEVMKQTTIEGTKTTYEIETLIDAMDVLPASKKMFDQVKKAAEEIGYGKVYAKVSNGASDSAVSASMGIATLCGMGIKGWNAHTSDEMAQLSDLFAKTELATMFMMNYEGLED